MKNVSMLLQAVLAVLAFVSTASVATANIWMDENFEGVPFTQGNGTLGGVPNATLDTYSSNALTNQVSTVLTQTGAVVSTKSFNGTNSYEMEVGETLAVGEPYQDQANGNYQLFQFAVSVDPIPAAGTVGEFRWNFDMDSTTAPAVDYSFYVRLESTGTSVNLIGGEDVANVSPLESTIGSLASASEFQFVTLMIQKNNASEATQNTPPGGSMPVGNFAQGMYFFVSSETPAATIPLTGSAPPMFASRDWEFTVTSGTVYLDNMYWDGGMDTDQVFNGGDKSHERNFASGQVSAVADWNLY